MNMVVAVLDIGADPNMIDRQLIAPSWTNRTKQVRHPKLRGVKSDKLNVLGVILLQVRIGYLKDRAWFGIIDKLAVRALLGTSFTDRFLKYILTDERATVPKN